MGSSKTGLVGTIGVTLLNPDGTTHTVRATADIYEIGGGCYGKNFSFPDDWIGSIEWDTGGGSPVYAVEEYAYYAHNPKVDTILTDTDDLQTNQENWITAVTVALSAQGKLDVNAECDAALSDYGANTTVPDVAGVAAGLHNATDSLITIVDTVVDAIKAKTDNLPVDPADQSQVDASIAALNNITVADIIAGIVDGSYDLQEMIRLIFAACCNVSSGGGTTNLVFKNSAENLDRITATVDANGNRTNVILDGS